MRWIAGGILSVVIILGIAGCGDEEAAGRPSPTPSGDAGETPTSTATSAVDDAGETPTPDPTPTPTPPDGGAATASNAPTGAIADYIATTGLDGETFEFADPVDCASIEDAELNAGKVCLAFQKSEIGEAAAEIEAELVGSPRFWTLTLKLQDGTWVVMDVASGLREGSRS